MPRRNNGSLDETDEKDRSIGMTTSLDFKVGDIVTDITGKKWKLGTSVGIGGFGEIYDAYENVRKDVKTDASYVAKFERHSNGPLFVEINCYLRIARQNMIEDWKKEKGLKYLGMPHYVASGSHSHQDGKYRFLLLPKYKRDLGQILSEKKIFNVKTVLTILIQILDVLEYIHSRGYVHSDIKASNIMLGETTVTEEVKALPTRKVPIRTLRSIKPIQSEKKVIRPNRTRHNLRSTSVVNYLDDIPYLDEVLNACEKTQKGKKQERNKLKEEKVEHIYLLDYGLASKYILSNGEHREFCTDERRAHAGTTLFCSRDAHKGVVSRRSDLESLAYNMIYWLTGSLPWIDDLAEPEEVEKKKIRSFKHLQSFLGFCFNNNCPQFLIDYFSYLNQLQFQETPNYKYCKQIFEEAFHTFGCENDSLLNFNNDEGMTKKVKRKNLIIGRGVNMARFSFLKTSPLMPLNSNIVFKRPKLRKAAKNIINTDSSMMHWSKILIDPEEIIKQGRERRVTDGSDGSTHLSLSELESLNPTYAMIEVYNKCMERETSPSYKSDCSPIFSIEGYTPAMMSVYLKMKERQELEYQMQMCNNNNYITLKESQTPVRSKRLRNTRRAESPTTCKKQPKPNITVPTKKSASQTKKGRTPLVKKPYSLRG